MIRIYHNRIKCIGCNACVVANPDRWRMSRKDGKSVLLGGDENKGVYRISVTEDEYENNLLAAKNCPVKIIKIETIN